MNFNSYIFIFMFLPILLLGYYILKNFGKPLYMKLWIIAMTLWFYGYFNPGYILLIFFSVFINYLFFVFLSKKRNKGILAVGILCNLAYLFFFKYFDFFIENWNRVLHTDFSLLQILLPVGISFYTFQQISFLADTYRGEVKECSPVDYCTFVLFFPQLVSGPIVTHGDMLPQIQAIEKKDFDIRLFSQGILLFVLGLFKKVMIADVFGGAVNWGYDNISQLDSTNAILVMLFYTIQLYFDFSGYCDMAVGLANLMGFKLPVNFNSPYKAINLIDFWKRWHITLTRFLTRNVYIPLGGNRKGAVRTYLNFLLVFLVSGFWHGASWTFVIWGLIHGVLYVLTKLGMPVIRKIPSVITGFITFIIVNVAFVFFRSQSIGQAISLLRAICSLRFGAVLEKLSANFELTELWYALKITNLDKLPFSRMYCMLIYLIGSLGILFFAKNTNELAERFKPHLFGAIILGFLFTWCVVSFSGVSTFLYFNF